MLNNHLEMKYLIFIKNIHQWGHPVMFDTTEVDLWIVYSLLINPTGSGTATEQQIYEINCSFFNPFVHFKVNPKT